MNMKKVLIPALSVAALVLGGCAMKCDYAKFHEKAVAAAQKEVKLTKGTIKYTSKSSTKETSAEYHITWNAGNKYWSLDEGSILDSLFITATINARADSVGESEDYTYYAGATFKVETKDATYKYQGNGFITSYVAEGTKMTVSYK